MLKQGNGDVLLADDAQIALIQDTNITAFETALTEVGLWDNTTCSIPTTCAPTTKPPGRPSRNLRQGDSAAVPGSRFYRDDRRRDGH
jgi:hypothetical protein